MTKEKKPAHVRTRFAPSPTGFLHIGGLGMCLVDYMVAKSMGGKVFLRIEDTDQKREIDGAAEKLIRELASFGFSFDGEPIYQSARADIYKKYAEQLVAEGKAYYDDKRKEEEEDPTAGVARGGDHPLPENQSSNNKCIRFKAPAKTIIEWGDLVKGKMRLPGLERDPVILKSNGLPPYNFAHVVDDTLMKTTHVVRGEEWLPSTAEHIQLFRALGWTPPEYAHLPVISVMENGNKRKLSKRKDKEALVGFFLEAGYPIDALIIYLLTIYNTDFEIWSSANPKKHWRDFHFRFEKIGSNSPLFDMAKLDDISKNLIGDMNCKQINAEVKKFFGDKYSDKDYEKIFEILAIDRGSVRPRKDIAKWSDIPNEFDYLFRPLKMTPLLERYKSLFLTLKDKDDWLVQMKIRAPEFGFKNMRDFTQAIRVAITGRERSTDLYTISKVLFKDK
jgi:glutamyl-tRNA synthetase